MIVEIDAKVFENAASLLDLAALIALCRGDPHALLLDPHYDPASPPAWLTDFGELRDEIALIFEYGPDAAAQRPRTCPRIRVIAGGPSDWTASPPHLSIRDASRLLRRPLDVVVENRRNDGAFLRKMLPPERRRELERWEREGTVRIDSEGGMGEMQKRVEKAARSPEEAARLWLLFDRDCRGATPASSHAREDASRELQDLCRPSDDAARLKESCRKVTTPWPLEYWMLERRAIENYLPLSALYGWAGADRNRRALVEAFDQACTVVQAGLTQESQRARQRARRFCFPMKKGLLDDVTNDGERERLRSDETTRLEDRHLSALYHVLDAELRRLLRRGFGKQIAQLFHEESGVERVSEDHFALEVDPSERIAIAESIARTV